MSPRIAVQFTAVFLATSLVASLHGQATPDVDQELDAVRQGLAEAYNSGDLDLLLSYCHDDVIAIWQNGAVANGHQGVRDVVSQLTQADNKLISTFSADPTVVYRQFLADGGVVVSSGRLNDKYTLVRPAGKEVQLNSNWSATLAKLEDRWLVVSFHVSTNAFDNEVITLYDDITRWTTGAVAGLIGLVLGGLCVVLLRGSGKRAAKG